MKAGREDGKDRMYLHKRLNVIVSVFVSKLCTKCNYSCFKQLLQILYSFMHPLASKVREQSFVHKKKNKAFIGVGNSLKKKHMK